MQIVISYSNQWFHFARDFLVWAQKVLSPKKPFYPGKERFGHLLTVMPLAAHKYVQKVHL